MADDPDLDPAAPRVSRDLLDELERMDRAVEAQGIAEERTMFDPREHPKPPHPKEEGTTDRAGRREVDVMADTANLGELTVDVDDDGEVVDDVDLREIDL